MQCAVSFLIKVKLNKVLFVQSGGTVNSQIRLGIDGIIFKVRQLSVTDQRMKYDPWIL